jgi:xanthine dehydrogenase accessory factor
MHWMTAVSELRRERKPGVLVTVTAVRGHAPRETGAKMVVGERHCWGTIGGGNLEQTALIRARAMIASGAAEPETSVTSLSDRAPAQHGIQCCGGEVTLLFEPLRPVPAIAVFGVGHVGTELALVLCRHDIELHLVDSRARHLDPERLAPVTDNAVARVHLHHAVVPELMLGEIPSGSHVLIMTHDHAEDAALCDAALRCGHLGSIGLIGSAAKWSRFARKLAAEGHDEAALARITTPIGLPDIAGKQPATIAVSVAADLLRRLEREQSTGAAGGYPHGGAATSVRPRAVS